MSTLEQRATAVKLVCFDFDGVFTARNQVICGWSEQQGYFEQVTCSRADGIGLDRLRALGVHLAVISTEPNPVVKARCEKLKIACYQGIADKRFTMEKLAAYHGISLAECAFLGNDVNDLEALRAVGLPALVADCESALYPAERLILSRNGGEGAVREFCDWIADIKERAPLRINPHPAPYVEALKAAHWDSISQMGHD